MPESSNPSESAGGVVPLRHSLRLRLVLLSCGLLLATAAVLLSWGYRDLAEAALAQQQRELEILSQSAAAHINQLAGLGEEPLQALARETAFRVVLRTATLERDPQALATIADEALDVAEGERGLASLQVYDVSGLPLAGFVRRGGELRPETRVYSFTNEPEALELARRLPVGEARTIGPLVDDHPDAGSGTAGIHLDIAVPIFDDRGTRIGVALGEYDMESVVAALRAQADERRSAEHAGFVLVDLYGRATGDERAAEVAVHRDAIRALLDASPTRTAVTRLDFGTGRHALAAATVVDSSSDPGRYSFVAFIASEAAVLAGVRAAFLDRLLASALLLVAAVAVTLLFARSLVRPLDRLVEATERFGTGRPVTGLPTGRRDEVGRLGLAFERAVEQVEQRKAQVDQEIRKRQRTEDALREKAQRLEASEASFRSLYESVGAGVGVYDPEGRVTAANPALVRMLGYPSERALCAADVARELWAGPGTLEEYLRAVRQEGELRAAERRLRRLDGRMVWVLENVHAVWDDAGNVLRYESTCVDITDRKHAEYAQRASEMRFRRLSDSNVIGVAFGSLATGLVTELNNYVLRLLGYQHADLPLPLASVLSPDWRDVIERVRATGLLRQPLDPFQKTLRHRDGSEVPVLVNVTLVDPHGDEFVAAIVDQSASVASLRQLRELKEFFHFVLDSIPTRIAYVDRDQHVRFFNRAYLDWYGTTAAQVEGRHLADVIGRDRFEAAADQIDRALGGQYCRYEASVDRGGRTHYADIMYVPHRDDAGVVVGFFSVAHDVTEARELEARLRQSQRLEAVGQLTGGIAHDFNNLLSVVIGNLQLQERHLGPDERARRCLDAALKAALRGADLTRQLLGFSRRQSLAPRVLRLEEHVTSVLTLLERTLGESIELEAELPEGLWPVAMDAGQFDSAILNLAINARDAMEGAGTLRVTARNLVLAPADLLPGEEAAPGEYVSIAVSDTGAGMDAEVRARAFEPFYTTKAAGKGNGLGLAMVYGFVHQSGGLVRLSSAPGQGTTVEMLFPRHAGVQPALASGADPVAPEGGSERVLVVEDDAAVRETLCAMLADLGYQVRHAADGPAALALLEQHADIDLVISDVAMPGGLRGPELVAEVRRRWSGIATLLTTGFADAREFRRAGLDPAEVLWKPYPPAELARRVRRALETRGRAGPAVVHG